MRGIWRMLIAILGLGLGAGLQPAPQARAATSLEDVSLSPDMPTSLEAGALLVNREDVMAQCPGDSSALADLGALPATGAVRAYHFDPGGPQLFAVDTPMALGSITALARDVVRFDGSNSSLEFEGGVAGVPDGTSIDAVSRIASDLLLSFDTPLSLAGVLVSPGDLVRWDGANATVVFDAAANGVPSGVNLDAAHYLTSNDHLLLSFDDSGNLGDVDFDDEDVLEFDSMTWELAIDAGTADSGWIAANLEALHAIAASDDNCPGALNPSQTDTDGDSQGNVCDDDDDGDGLLDVVETDTGIFIDPNDTGSDPLDPDSDDDGLDDGEDVALGTNPNNPDEDDDDVCDGGGTGGGACESGPDNCPFVPNYDQANGDASPAGDACQCGDLDQNGIVEQEDATIARQKLVGASIGVSYDMARCNVVGPKDGGATDCSVADIFLLRRFLEDPSTQLGNVCQAYGGP